MNDTLQPEQLVLLETAASELIKEFDVKTPPVPVESMLQKPRPGMWDDVNISQLTGSFLSVRDQYSPRMSMARLLARHVVTSDWGKNRKLNEMIRNEENTRIFARMIIMPREMVMTMTTGARNPVAMSMHFEVPEEDAQKRLMQLASL